MRDLEPGPELDALVWKHVMGRKPHETEIELFDWSPSTSIADACEVLGKFAYWEAWSKPKQVTHFYMELVQGDPYAGFGEADAPTIPHAICLAALKSVGALDERP